jgi:hypothetical protein
MVRVLPNDPRPKAMEPDPLRSTNRLDPAFGGPVGRISRLGARWAFNVEMPELTYGESLKFRPILNDREPVSLELVQPGIDLSDIGSPVVDGSGQLGASLTLRGVNNGVAIPEGAFLTIVHAGQPYLFAVDEGAVTSGGKVTLKVDPMLADRTAFADGDSVELAAPYVQGYAQADGGAFKAGPGGYVPGLRFRIEEAE